MRMRNLKCPVVPLIFALFAAAGTAASGGWEQAGGLSGNVAAMKRGAAADKENISPSPAGRAGRLICLDPGHPSPFNSGGAVSNGTTEAHINWAVAQKLRKILIAKGAEVMMTKSSEAQKVDNRVRALLINEAAVRNGGTAVAVHLHCDAGKMKGFSLFYPDRKGTYTGVNGTEPDIGATGPDATVQTTSRRLASVVHAAMVSGLSGKLNDLGVKGDSKTAVGGRQGALSYSIFSKIPTITIEMVVLTNAGDAAFIKSEEGQQKMAEAIAAGLLKY
jgi:N-acetylmuramoyl-L-alanine amidase